MLSSFILSVDRHPSYIRNVACSTNTFKCLPNDPAIESKATANHLMIISSYN